MLFPLFRFLLDFDSSVQAITETVCHGACTIASEFPQVQFSGKILAITESGRTARLISKYRPALPILAFSESVRVVRELALVWGVRAYHAPMIINLPLEERAVRAIGLALEIGYLGPDDKQVCILSSSHLAGAGFFTGVYDVPAVVNYTRLQGKDARRSVI